jgi:SpoVK/Ycf46/Vps4 family AAA+-type ATPase
MAERPRKSASSVGNADQLLSLLRSHARRDDRRFISVALQLAEDAARKGHAKVAEEMQAVISEARTAMSALEMSREPIPLAKPRGELAGIITASFPKIVLADLVLPAELTGRLRKIVKEHEARGELGNFGLHPRRKFLLCGPPGTGKTMTASAVAGELNFPLFTVQLDGLITKFMGETAAKLRLVFDAMSTTRGVYLFDEVDALATARATGNDVGEARRILNSLLQFLEDDKSNSLIFAATNHPELLDKAVFRRFDSLLRYGLPSADLVRPILSNNLLAFDLKDIDWQKVADASRGLSQADLTRAAEDAARDAVLERNGILSTDLLTGAVAERRESNPQ